MPLPEYSYGMQTIQFFGVQVLKLLSHLLQGEVDQGQPQSALQAGTAGPCTDHP